MALHQPGDQFGVFLRQIVVAAEAPRVNRAEQRVIPAPTFRDVVKQRVLPLGQHPGLQAVRAGREADALHLRVDLLEADDELSVHGVGVRRQEVALVDQTQVAPPKRIRLPVRRLNASKRTPLGLPRFRGSPVLCVDSLRETGGSSQLA